MPSERRQRLAELQLAVLGLEPGVSFESVRSTYRALASKWHPDKYGDDPGAESVAGERLRQINAAYEWLRDNRNAWEPVSAPVTPSGPPPQPRTVPVNREPQQAAQQTEQQRRSDGPSGRRPPVSPESEPRWPNPEVIKWLVAVSGFLFLIGLVVSQSMPPAASTPSRPPVTSRSTTVLPPVSQAAPSQPRSTTVLPPANQTAPSQPKSTPVLPPVVQAAPSPPSSVTTAAVETSKPSGLEAPVVVSEDFQGEVVSWVEAERLPWRGFTVIELAAPQVVSDWFGWVGADRLLIFDQSGDVVDEVSAPFRYWLENVTGPGGNELVIERLPAGVSGCCTGLQVLTVERDQLHTLFSAGAFGNVGLRDVDGDSLPEVVGESLLPSDVLANVERLTLPFVCKWDGGALRDVTGILGRIEITAKMAGLRSDMRESGYQRGSIELYGLALLLSDEEAHAELAWMTAVVSSEALARVNELVPDIRRNVAEWKPCSS